MVFVLKEGQGSLFKNEKKSEKSPDYSGSLRIGGVDYRLAGWRHEGRMSLQATPKDESVVKAVGDKRPWKEKLNDDIGF